MCVCVNESIRVRDHNTYISRRRGQVSLHRCSRRARLAADVSERGALGGGGATCARRGRQRLGLFLRGLQGGLDLRDAGGRRHLRLDGFAAEVLEAVAGSWPGTRRSGSSGLRSELTRGGEREED